MSARGPSATFTWSSISRALQDGIRISTFTPVLSEQSAERYRSGLVMQAVIEDFSDFDGWKAYVAGPPAMVDAAMEATFARGLRQMDMHADVFFTAAPADAL